MNIKKPLLIFIFSYFTSIFSMTINMDFTKEECKHTERDIPQLYIVKGFCLKNEILKAFIEYDPTFLEIICNKTICKCRLENLIHEGLLIYNRRDYRVLLDTTLRKYHDQEFVNDKDKKFEGAEKRLINFIVDKSSIHSPATDYYDNRNF